MAMAGFGSTSRLPVNGKVVTLTTGNRGRVGVEGVGGWREGRNEVGWRGWVGGERWGGVNSFLSSFILSFHPPFFPMIMYSFILVSGLVVSPLSFE